MDINTLVDQINFLAGRNIYYLRTVRTTAEASQYGGRDGMVPQSVDNPSHSYTLDELKAIYTSFAHSYTPDELKAMYTSYSQRSE